MAAIWQSMGEPSDQFPVGMRVLAVDDDHVSLKILEILLRRCQYHVTTTNHTTEALALLRENKSEFDLVITEIYMPEMDGFKLAKLVGLEMDLPVLMLSANDDTKIVMKAITHGACGFLVKPIRFEEIKNIWQHVVRRNKFDLKNWNDFEKPRHESEREKVVKSSGDSNLNVQLPRERKDKNEEDGGGHSNQYSSTQKKPPVVWTMDLHFKFVAAVNQLGIEKAVPKRIKELMNEEKMTREDVASHLQKYRLFLRRVTSKTGQRANMVAALGGSDSDFSYLRKSSTNGVENLGKAVNDQCMFQQAILPGNPNENILHRMVTPLEFETPQHYEGITLPSTNMEFPSHLQDFTRCAVGWPVIQSSATPVKSFTPSDFFKQGNVTDQKASQNGHAYGKVGCLECLASAIIEKIISAVRRALHCIFGLPRLGKKMVD